MKVLAIMGSPHKGNTLELTRRFEEKLKRHGDLEFEYQHLRKANIQPCRGCFTCFVKGEDKCPIKNDDKPAIAAKMDEADGVVFVTPVYSMHVSYLLKQFLDRFAYNGHRPRYFGKYAVILAATGGMGLEPTLKYLSDWTSAWGFEVVDQLGYVAPPKNTGYKALIKKKDRTEEVAQTFYRAMKEKNPRKLSFSDHISFEMMTTILPLIREMSPTDYAFGVEKGWFEQGRTYFTDHARGNPFYRLIAKVIAWHAGRGIGKQLAEQG